MCGLLFSYRQPQLTQQLLAASLQQMHWRGPDAEQHSLLQQGQVFLGHRRLSILDPQARSNQPMRSRCGRFYIVFNGEIYNHMALRQQLGLQCQTLSDTETIVEAYAQHGERIVAQLDGMFALVIYDLQRDAWVCARDAFGIKPLFIHQHGVGALIGSEAAVLAELIGAAPDPDSLHEWQMVRRPTPGYSYFQGVREVPPGTLLRSDGSQWRHFCWEPSGEPYVQEHFEQLLRESVAAHELSDVANVALLSGGLDSAVIAALSNVRRCYSVGLQSNNEFTGAAETAQLLGRQLQTVTLTPAQLQDNWRQLTRLRREPLGVPNEGLIYPVCQAMQADEKVVLTGEGADELLFGYDGIFRWSLDADWPGVSAFLSRYGYAGQLQPTPRLNDYVLGLKGDNSTQAFVEDFFYQFHLPGLLRRMDFASMAASKEARVPFVSKSLVRYMYRRPAELKIDAQHSKIPLRIMAQKLGLQGALQRKKIGFSAQTDISRPRQDDYRQFQCIVMEALGW